MQDLLVEIFYDVDNCSIAFENYYKSSVLAECSNSDFAILKSKNLSLSEVMTIIIYFHLYGLKSIYLQHLMQL